MLTWHSPQAFLCVLRETRFYQKAYNSIFPLETRFFSHETRFFGHFTQILYSMMDFRGILNGMTLFMPFLLPKFVGKGKILLFLSINRGNPSKNELKLVFKMVKLVFKTPKLPCPAFSLQGLGWIPHKKKPACFVTTITCDLVEYQCLSFSVMYPTE